MGDWNLPVLTDPYANFQDSLKSRDFDAISLGFVAITNPQAGMMRYVRASNKFQEYDGSNWIDKVLSVAGGGTGATTPGGIVANLGLGTMASQNANNVAITGGSLSGLNSLQVNGAGSVNGRWDIGGGSYVAGLFEARGGAAVTGALSATGSITAQGNINAAGNMACARIDASALIITYADCYARGVFRAGPSDIPFTNPPDGTILASRIGYGYTGNGTRVLKDNNTWGDAPGMFLATMNENVSFGSAETAHAINISGLGVVDPKEIMILSYGPFELISQGIAYAVKRYQVWVEKPTSTTFITVRRTIQDSPTGSNTDSSDNDLGPSSHAFFIARVKVG